MGCYKADAMLVYVECIGLPANEMIRFAYNLWYLPAYGVILLVEFPQGALFGLVVFSPIIYFLWYLFWGKSLAKNEAYFFGFLWMACYG